MESANAIGPVTESHKKRDSLMIESFVVLAAMECARPGHLKKDRRNLPQLIRISASRLGSRARL